MQEWQKVFADSQQLIIDENGKEVLMTKDHIIPKSKGGANDISNYQTMCKRCNEAKRK